MTWPNSTRNTPSGLGSRGGRWHDPAFRRHYYRVWRSVHPEYQERERMRRYRSRHGAGASPGLSRLAAVPAAVACGCLECDCTSQVTQVVCGMCQKGLHDD